MIKNPKLYALVPRKEARPQTAPHKKHSLVELRKERVAELAAKIEIDEVHEVLSRLEARANDYSRQIASLELRKKLALARRDRIQEEVIRRMQAARLSQANGISITLLAVPAKPSVVVTDEAALPEQYVRETLVSTPLRDELRSALQGGIDVPGAELRQTVYLKRERRGK